METWVCLHCGEENTRKRCASCGLGWPPQTLEVSGHPDEHLNGSYARSAKLCLGMPQWADAEGHKIWGDSAGNWRIGKTDGQAPRGFRWPDSVKRGEWIDADYGRPLASVAVLPPFVPVMVELDESEASAPLIVCTALDGETAASLTDDAGKLTLDEVRCAVAESQGCSVTAVQLLFGEALLDQPGSEPIRPLLCEVEAGCSRAGPHDVLARAFAAPVEEQLGVILESFPEEERAGVKASLLGLSLLAKSRLQ